MADPIIEVAEDFWNFRGSYKIGGVVDVGTHASLVRRSNGRFVLLDAYTFSDAVVSYIGDLTRGGRDIEAILNLHPFHTLHVENAHKQYPDATLYGTARHRKRFPGLPWHELSTDAAALHERFGVDLGFSVPQGVDFISADENVHFSSVLVFHRASLTIHSDDTLMYLGLPRLMKLFGLGDAVSFHPTLGKALERRAGAARDFRTWAEGMIEEWKDAANLCAAHTATLLGRDNHGDSIHARLTRALRKVESTLRKHEGKYG